LALDFKQQLWDTVNTLIDGTKGAHIKLSECKMEDNNIAHYFTTKNAFLQLGNVSPYFGRSYIYRCMCEGKRIY